MWRSVRSSLGPRIVAGVTVCLTLILTLFLVVALWTIDESAKAAARERVTLARVLAGRVDEVLGYALVSLQREAADLVLEPGRGLGDDHRRRLSSLPDRVGSLANIAVVDADGTPLWADPSGAELSPEHPGVRLALETGLSQVTELPLGRSTFACLVVPLRGTGGRVTGALMAELDPGHPGLGLLPARGIAEGVHAQLINEQGRLVAGTGESGPRAALEHAYLLAEPMQTRGVGYHIHEARPDAPHASHAVAYAPVALLPSWVVTIEQPDDPVLAMPGRLRVRLALLGAVSLWLVMALAWLDVRRVVRPLTRLTRAAERFASGQLDEPLAIERRDELGILAGAFESMRVQVRASRDLARNLAVQEERERLAREMHDGFGQVLGYVNTKALAIGRLLEVGKVGEARVEVAQLEAAAKEVYADAREAILGLRTTLGPDRDLPSALREYVEGFEQQSGIVAEVQTTTGAAEPPLPLAAELQLMRIVQEALANVRKHARATRAVVRLESRDGSVRLSIEDDGQGLDPARMAHEGWPHFGLQTMRERAQAIGGTFAIESVDGGGTRVLVTIPRDGREGAGR